jgi:hypothetical protein
MFVRRLVEVATAQIGYKETGVNITKYGEWYGMNGASWCAMFVSWCFAHVVAQAGGGAFVPSPLGRIQSAKGYAHCTTAYAWAHERGLTSTTPKPGYCAMYDHDGSPGGVGHTGLVISTRIDPATKAIWYATIEGNANMQNSRNGNRVAQHSHMVGSAAHGRLLGFMIPANQLAA